MSGRGGSNRRKILPVNQDQLQEVIDAAVAAFGANAFYLGAYEGVKTTQAASCQGLYDCKWWLEKLLPICNGEIVPQQLKVCLKKHAGSHNESHYKDDLWAGRMAAKFVVLLNHWRRLKYNPEKRRQAMLKATPQMQASVPKLLDLEPGLSEAYDKAKTSSGEACEKAKEADESSLSEVSLDSKGFPNMLRTPDTKKGAAASSCRGLKESQAPEVFKGKTPSPKTSRKKDHLPILLSKKAQSHRDTLESQAAAAAEHLAEKTPEKKRKAKAGKRKRPAASSSSQKAAKRLAKRPAANLLDEASQRQVVEKREGVEVVPGQSGWEKIKAEKYTKQSYIRGWWTDKWHLLVACSEKQASSYPGGHHAVIDALEPHCHQQGMNKDKLVELRNNMLA